MLLQLDCGYFLLRLCKFCSLLGKHILIHFSKIFIADLQDIFSGEFWIGGFQFA
jgi:hypothetical protein